MKKLTTLFILTITASTGAFAQIVPDLTKTPQQLVVDHLVGPGITVSGVTFNGMPGTIPNPQIGFFSGSNSTGIDSGIVITNGHVNNILGPNNTTAVSMAWGVPCFDADLNSLSPGLKFDPGILEFDFIPTGDSVKFSFVMGSEEYMEYYSVADIFGIFLSGPGISGPFSGGGQNIATILGGTPISIGNINAYVNPSFYVDNGAAIPFAAPFATNPYYIEYDGMTVKITAKWAVNCGSTYHIKFAIADYSDDILDSGVFIEAGSFTSAGSTVAVSVPSVSGAGPNSVFEGCALGSTVDYTFTRPDTSGIDTLYFTIGGTATNGVDYSLISPSYVVYAAGQETATITINVFNDGIIEGSETVTITTVPSPTACGGFAPAASVTLTILDPYTVIPFAGNDTVYNCPGQTLVFNGITLNGNPPYSYGWSDGTTGATINYTITSLGADSLILTVTDGCGYIGTDTLIMTQVAPSIPLQANAGPDIYYNCPGDSSLVIGIANGGVAPYTYLWEGIFVGPNYYYVANPDTVVVLTVTDFCGNTDSDTLYAIQNPPIPLVANAGPDVTITCPGQTIVLTGTYTGGAGGESVFWTEGMTVTNTNPYTVQPLSSTLYIFHVMNTCGQFAVDSVFVTVPPYTPLNFTLSDDHVEVNCPGTAEVLTVTSVSGGTGPYNYEWSNFDMDSTTTVVVDTNAFISVIITDACGLDTSVIIPLTVLGGSVDLEFYDNRYCKNADSTALVPLTVTGGIAPYTFTWSAQPGGSVSVDAVAMSMTITNPVNGFYNLTITDACGATDYDTAEVIMQNCDLEIPNVMTPNGDGVNDFFVIGGLSAHPNTILKVFNRWGSMVFIDTDYSNDWDGAGLAAGVYFYVIQLTDGTVPSEYHGYLNIFY